MATRRKENLFQERERAQIRRRGLGPGTARRRRDKHATALDDLDGGSEAEAPWSRSEAYLHDVFRSRPARPSTAAGCRGSGQAGQPSGREGSVRDAVAAAGYLQRSAVPPRLLDPERFLSWLERREHPLNAHGGELPKYALPATGIFESRLVGSTASGAPPRRAGRELDRAGRPAGAGARVRPLIDARGHDGDVGPSTRSKGGRTWTPSS